MNLEAPEALGLSYVIKTQTKPDLPIEFVREIEMEDSLNEYILRNITPFNADKFLAHEDMTRFLFERLIDDGIITVKDTAHSGRYFRFNADMFLSFRSSYLKDDPFYLEGEEVGKRYYEDAFQAIERAVIDGFGSASKSPETWDSGGIVQKPDSNFFQSERRKAEFVIAANTSLKNIESAELSNSEKAQARGYLIAAKALAETPDPPTDLIWIILSRANSMAGIASFFLALLTLIATVAL